MKRALIIICMIMLTGCVISEKSKEEPTPITTEEISNKDGSTEEELDLNLVSQYTFTIFQSPSDGGNKEIVIDKLADIQQINDFLVQAKMVTYYPSELTKCEPYGSVKIFLNPDRELDFGLYTASKDSFEFADIRYSNPNVISYIYYENKRYDDLIKLVSSFNNKSDELPAYEEGPAPDD